MFDLSSSTWCDTFTATSARPALASGFEFIPRPIRIPLVSQPDVRYLMRLAREHNWQFNYPRVQRFLRNPLHVLLLTDTRQQIQFVSQGFTKMTGYTSAEALGKSPSFLQGPETSAETKQWIRRDLSDSHAFEGDLLNYRKNGETYWCHVEILPLRNPALEVTHYMAFEWEIASDN